MAWSPVRNDVSRSRHGESSVMKPGVHPRSFSRVGELPPRQERSTGVEHALPQSRDNFSRREESKIPEGSLHREDSSRPRSARTPPPRPQREEMAPPPTEQGEVSSIPKTRRPALERLSLGGTSHPQPLPVLTHSVESDHLQDIEIRYAEEANQ
ncbi:predicted protein [Arabidopsis lyrata subsp. lyrata]|uniref:Predicted protein n=1 Tax=Arabidopsis lyrata subsp. lyrata TaxID=81972 RepID=D7LBE3_ARALL|nr:predicted protein [Arabidopsis lyrata subsp. lyrata]